MPSPKTKKQLETENDALRQKIRDMESAAPKEVIESDVELSTPGLTVTKSGRDYLVIKINMDLENGRLTKEVLYKTHLPHMAEFKAREIFAKEIMGKL